MVENKHKSEKQAVKLPVDVRNVFDKSTCLYSRQEVEAALDKIAHEINQDLADANPIFLCVVVGGMIPLGNLLPRLDFPLQVDYVHATRYKDELEGKDLEWKVEPRISLEGRVVVVVDDILDSGLTMQAVIDFCHNKKAKKVYSAALVDKNDARKPGGLQTCDYTGLFVENRWLFGYGLDYKNYLRNAPGIYAVAAEHEA